jgi:hypothetical protein
LTDTVPSYQIRLGRKLGLHIRLGALGTELTCMHHACVGMYVFVIGHRTSYLTCLGACTNLFWDETSSYFLGVTDYNFSLFIIK